MPLCKIACEPSRALALGLATHAAHVLPVYCITCRIEIHYAETKMLGQCRYFRTIAAHALVELSAGLGCSPWAAFVTGTLSAKALCATSWYNLLPYSTLLWSPAAKSSRCHSLRLRMDNSCSQCVGWLNT